jgi:hypothetical protein
MPKYASRLLKVSVATGKFIVTSTRFCRTILQNRVNFHKLVELL